MSTERITLSIEDGNYPKPIKFLGDCDSLFNRDFGGWLEQDNLTGTDLLAAVQVLMEERGTIGDRAFIVRSRRDYIDLCLKARELKEWAHRVAQAQRTYQLTAAVSVAI